MGVEGGGREKENRKILEREGAKSFLAEESEAHPKIGSWVVWNLEWWFGESTSSEGGPVHRGWYSTLT